MKEDARPIVHTTLNPDFAPMFFCEESRGGQPHSYSCSVLRAYITRDKMAEKPRDRILWDAAPIVSQHKYMGLHFKNSAEKK